MHRTPSVRAHQQRRIRHHAANTDSYAFFNLLTRPELLAHLESLLPDHVSGPLMSEGGDDAVIKCVAGDELLCAYGRLLPSPGAAADRDGST